MNYDEWLEAQKMTDDAEARRLYEEQGSGVGYYISHPYHVWRERYGYADTATARADYAEYQKQLDILTPEKRKPGRPATGKAMTPAEKQRAYRERQKKRETELEARVLVLEQQLENALAEIERIKGGGFRQSVDSCR